MDDRSFVAQALFHFLEHSRIDYCVVGDARGYPEMLPSDIDIVVSQEGFAEVPRILARFCSEYGVHLVQMIQHEQTAIYFVLAWIDDSGRLHFLAPDFCSDYYRGGRRFLAASDILMQRRLVADDAGGTRRFYVPPPHMQFIYYLLKKVDKRSLDDDHGQYLSDLWQEDPDGASSQIRRFWRVPGDVELFARAAAANQWHPVRSALPQLREALHRSVPFSIPGVLAELRRRAARMLHPTGFMVAVLGPDGSGKSSVIERVLVDLAPVFRNTRYMHLRPRLIGAGGGSIGAVTNPHALPVRGGVASWAKLAYFISDYTLGFVLRVWPLMARSTLVAFDRYYHDLLVDPERYRYGGSMTLARWSAKCVPSPDMWVLLHAPADVLQARKREVPVDETERQRRAYFELLNRLPNATVVDASQNIAQVATEVECAVLRFLEQRIESRCPRVRLKENPFSARLLLFFCRKKVPILSKWVRIIFNSDIYFRIRSPILMPHPYGIIIHSKAVIGSRVTVMQQVTIGSKDPDKNVAPVIEDEVYIGAGAKVLGGIRVGKGAIIGANAVVTRDVPPYCTVVGANRIVRGTISSEPDGEAAAEAYDAPACGETSGAARPSAFGDVPSATPERVAQ